MSAGGGLQLRLRHALPGFTLELDETLAADGCTVVFGASGSGKTTLLRCIAGLERAAGGHVQWGQAPAWQDEAARRFLPTWQRPIGYVFQEPSLFPHLSVLDNLRLGLGHRPSRQAMAFLDEMVGLLGIGNLLARGVQALSGGERQRVAIARALATQPALLLLDEPLAALDPGRREELLPWLERLRRAWAAPMLYVTHSVPELVRLADRVLVLEAGRVRAHEAVGTLMARIAPALLPPHEIGALLEGRLLRRDEAWGLALMGFDGGELWLRDPGLALGAALRVRVLANDVSLALQPAQDTSLQNTLPMRVDALAADAHPAQCLVRLRAHGGAAQLLARITRRAADRLRLAPGLAVWAQVKSVALIG